MQVDRLLARLSIAATPLALLLGATPAAAQDGAESVLLEPLPLFKAVCMGGGARLTRKTAADASFTALPDPARRAVGKTIPKTQPEALKAEPPEPAAVTNQILRISAGSLYLFVPAKDAPSGPLADSCIVLWQSAGEDDYLQARKLLLPDEDSVPMYLRPASTPNGFVFASTVSGPTRLTLATYGGWIALRSSAETPPADPQ